MVSSTTARVNFSRSTSSAPLTAAPVDLGGQLRPASRDRAPADRATRTARSRWSRGRRGSWSRPDRRAVRRVKASPVSGSRAAPIRSNRSRGGASCVLAGGAALGHQHADETRSSACGSGARAKSCGLGQLSGNSRSRKCGRASRVAIFHHEVAQRGAVAIHPEREHRAPGDLERHPLHRLAQIDRRVAGGARALRSSRRSPRSCAEPASTPRAA